MKLNNMMAPDGYTEIVEERGLFHKVFQGPDGIRQLAASRNPIHYPVGDKFNEIDLKWIDKGEFYSCDTALFEVKVYKNFKIEVKRNNNFCCYEISSIGGKNGYNHSSDSFIHEDTIVWFEDIVEGFDIYVELRVKGIEIFKVVKHKNAPHSIKWKVRYTKGFKLDPNKRGFEFSGKGEVAVSRDYEDLGATDEVNTRYTLETFGSSVLRRDKATRVKKVFDDPIYPIIIDAGVEINDIPMGGWSETSVVQDYPGGTFRSHLTNILQAGINLNSIQRQIRGVFGFDSLNLGKVYVIEAKLKITVDGLSYAGITTNPRAYFHALNPGNINAVTTNNITSGNMTQFTVTLGTAGISSIINNTGVRTLNCTNIVQNVMDHTGWPATDNAILGMRFDVGPVPSGSYYNTMYLGTGFIDTVLMIWYRPALEFNKSEQDMVFRDSDDIAWDTPNIDLVVQDAYHILEGGHVGVPMYFDKSQGDMVFKASDDVDWEVFDVDLTVAESYHLHYVDGTVLEPWCMVDDSYHKFGAGTGVLFDKSTVSDMAFRDTNDMAWAPVEDVVFTLTIQDAYHTHRIGAIGLADHLLNVKLTLPLLNVGGTFGNNGEFDLFSLTANATGYVNQVASAGDTADTTFPSMECAAGSGGIASASFKVLENSATGTVHPSGDVAEDLFLFTMSADGSIHQVSDGDCDFIAMTATSTGTVGNTSAGVGTFKQLVISTSCYTGVTGTASNTLPMVTDSITGCLDLTADGACTLPQIVIEESKVYNKFRMQPIYLEHSR